MREEGAVERVRAFRRLIKYAKKRGFLWTPCANCGQRMVVARSGKTCLNCSWHEK